MNRQVILDIETDSLTPSKIYMIVCRDIVSNEVFVFLEGEVKQFAQFLKEVDMVVAHNGLAFDIPVINSLLKSYVYIDPKCVIDTLVVSRLLDTNIEGGHSLAAWGERLGFPKGDFKDFSQFSQEMLDYCIQDTLVTLKLFEHFKAYIYSPLWKKSLRVEHDMVLVCNDLKTNGFHFDKAKGYELYEEITRDLSILDEELQKAFPPRSSLIREIHPKLTKSGTLSRTDFRWVEDGDLTPYQVDAPFSRIEFVPFNPGSPSQVVERLNEAGWKPYEKTKGHIETEKLLQRTRDKKEKQALKEKLEVYKESGWKVSEANLDTLPDKASTPDGQYRLESARKLVQRLTLQNRYTTLREWLTAVEESPDHNRIHGTFNHIGAWTHRMSHSNPNMANIPTFGGLPKTREPTFLELWKSRIDPIFRQFWSVPKGKLLVGVDAESIQLRILAHYMNDERFTQSLLSGKKEDKTDPHSMNQKALGSVCQNRDDAKTFIYAWLLGAGFAKVAQILKCTIEEAEEANDNFLNFYPGLKHLKANVIPNDANFGYFQGFDGRFVKQDSEHLMLAGYLQNGEACIMKHACISFNQRLKKEKIPYKMINFVHDEFIVETEDDHELGEYIKQVISDSIKETGESFNLNCPMAGSGGIGYNWYEIH